MTTSVGVHAETVPAQPALLRWVFSDGLQLTGRLVGAPGELGRMLGPGGELERALVEPGAVWTWLAEGHDWAGAGARVRDAITEAATDPAAWQVVAADDEVLELVAGDVIDRTLGDYIASHGGRIALLGATDDTVEVDLSGACAHCPAAGLTLHGRLQVAITERLGRPVNVHAAGADERPAWWSSLLRR